LGLTDGAERGLRTNQWKFQYNVHVYTRSTCSTLVTAPRKSVESVGNALGNARGTPGTAVGLEVGLLCAAPPPTAATRGCAALILARGGSSASVGVVLRTAAGRDDVMGGRLEAEVAALLRRNSCSGAALCFEVVLRQWQRETGGR
jgi:hypothetical protein